MATALWIVFLFLGIAFQFALTLARLETGISGIVCLIISLALCAYVERRRQANNKEETGNRIVASIAAIMLLIYVLQLPQRYEDQKKYDRILENARQIDPRNAQEQLDAE